MKPQIVMAYDPGVHNIDLSATDKRLEKSRTYKDLSTIIIVPTIGSAKCKGSMMPTKAAASWISMMTPPNQKVCRLWPMGYEVGGAYEQSFETIVNNNDLKNWKYALCLEADNIPPPDGLIKLQERMEDHPEFAAIGGLYFTKGFGGVAQIWGNPHEHPINFKPQKPRLDGGLQECNGTGMGFTLYRIEMFKDKRLRRPWFKSAASREEGVFTQDLYFAMDAKKHGYRFAIDCSVKVGHYDPVEDKVW